MPKCDICGRERKPEDHDYNPLQWLRHEPLGWYSSKDGEICPEDMTKMMESQL